MGGSVIDESKGQIEHRPDLDAAGQPTAARIAASSRSRRRVAEAALADLVVL